MSYSRRYSTAVLNHQLSEKQKILYCCSFHCKVYASQFFSLEATRKSIVMSLKFYLLKIKFQCPIPKDYCYSKLRAFRKTKDIYFLSIVKPNNFDFHRPMVKFEAMGKSKSWLFLGEIVFIFCFFMKIDATEEWYCCKGESYLSVRNSPVLYFVNSWRNLQFELS